MATVRLNGDASGYTEISAPSAAGNNKLVLPTSNGVNEQYLQTNGSNALTWNDPFRLKRGTAVASTSGTSIDFTSIPSWVKRVTLMLGDVSTTGSDYYLVRLGTASGIESGAVYYSMTGANTTSLIASAVNYTTGFGIQSGNATNAVVGQYTFTNIFSNTWIASGAFATNTSTCIFAAGRVELSGALTQLRLTTTGGTDTFDAGNINILYEG